MGKVKSILNIKTLDDYDFLDLGAGEGGSIQSSANKIGGRGLGIELNQAKVEKAQKAGIDVVLGSALDLDKIPGKVDYVVCDNFLEHLPTKNDVREVLEKASKVVKKFIYIAHPSFEDIDYLKSKGLKTYWSDWRGHKSMLTLTDMIEIFHDCGIEWVQIKPVYRIKDSDDERILPLEAGVDQFSYESKHGAKPSPKIIFDRDIYYSFDIIGLTPEYAKNLPKLDYVDRLNKQNHPIIKNWKQVDKPLK